ncbi:MAG: hypothetical protein LBH19_05245, partial [Dysgonamonadaceae bacterium]|nr:hypothetical protein [Dysgonamonadaceae bacterium]
MKVKKIVLFYVMLMVLSVSARAQSIKPENAGPLSASKLYWMLGAGSELYVYDNISSGVAYSSVWKNTDFTGNTLAIGPYYPSGTWGVGNAVLVAYFWNWDNTGVKITRVIPNPTGAATIQQFTVPRPSATVSWSGGEVNQITGEIYFSSREDATIQSNFRLGIYNPYTGTFKDSGKLQAKTATEAIEGTVYSDMAIDSDGNAYIMIHESSNNCTLVRVEVGENGAGWKYSKVKRFTSSNLFYVDTWGMAFLNGKLYVTGAQDRVVEINPLTGVSTNKGNPGHDIFDLASAQTAIVVRGRVYNDLDGDGVISTLEQSVTTSGSPSLAGDTIEIYDAAKNYKGFTTTNSGGEYFLMLDLDNTDYYIRLKRPRINGIKGVQTYAWAGTVTNQHSSYTVTAYSRDAQGNPVELTAEGPCTGVHDGNDPNTTNLNDARFYSKIHIGHNITGVVDFGITAMSDLGDAPYQSTFAGETTGAAAPVHFTYGKKLYLGNDVSTDNPTGATSVSAGVDDATDDGVWLVLEGQNIALSDTVLEANTTYTIKVKTSGPERLSGYLNVFTSCPNSGTISTTNMNSAFQTGFKVATNLQSTAGNDTITFTY